MLKTSAATRAAYARLTSIGTPGDQLALDPGPCARHRNRERRATRHELVEGEVVAGRIAKLPKSGAPFGSWIVLESEGGPLALPATADRGWTLLERALRDQAVELGDRVRIVFVGWRESREGRRYRLVQIDVLERSRSEVAA